ncbi:leucine-rich repeat-containing protein 66 [Lepus europaeus]|uniref:leucine-rich repeat-containing protein 66 n=1 Tax=Lepus europaeus TaxID=9983 RepID=UPI002B4886D4|nr:leucine-rich repeat-containing protein 66 [Lepus europaeus]XP_062069822.1 leucine-rich repeat-containing protein 66 [Lepus europaeus]
MKSLYFRAIVIVLGLGVAGTETEPSRKSSGFFSSECQWNEYLQTNCSFAGNHHLPAEGSQTAAAVDVSFNFFRVLLQCHRRKEEWEIKHLDLSNSLLSKTALSPLRCAPALEILNLSSNAIRSISWGLPSPRSSGVKHHGSGFRTGLLLLKVLILQRNQLSNTPTGLWRLKSLQSLDLSFNGILEIGLSDFHNCLQLENLYLKSNKIFKIHPDAFKDLKNLQVVDLSSNALITVLPMMGIALELPHLDVDLADNPWQCDDSVMEFQNSSAGSWREKWGAICNRSTGHKAAHRETPQSRPSSETHLPHTDRSHGEGHGGSQEERPGEGRRMPLSTAGRPEHWGSDLWERQSRLPRRARPARDVRAAYRRDEDAEQHADLTLAVCLSVLLTFAVAFYLGALARPYIDRLWLQRCRPKGPRAPGSAYANEGFYDDAVAATNTQHPSTHVHPGVHGPNLYENQDALSTAEPHLYLTVLPDGTQQSSRWRSSEQGSGDSRAGSRYDNVLLNSSAARARSQQAAPAPTYGNDVLGDFHYESVAEEDAPRERSVDVPPGAGTSLQTLSGSAQSGNPLDRPRSKEMPASVSRTPPSTNAQRPGENQERAGTAQAPSETAALPMEFSGGMQPVWHLNLQSAPQPRVKGAGAEADPSAYYNGGVPHGDPGGADPPIFPPRWGSWQDGGPANGEPVQKYAPPDPQNKLESDYDSDEGSLFTLSSTSSEGARDVTEAESRWEECAGVGEPLQDMNSRHRRDNTTSEESLEDNSTSQRILGKYENQEHRFEKLLISGPDSGLGDTHLDSVSDTHECDHPFSLPSSLGGSRVSGEVPGTFRYDYDTAPQPEAVEWHCSLRDLVFSSAGVPTAPDERDCQEGDSDRKATMKLSFRE